MITLMEEGLVGKIVYKGIRWRIVERLSRNGTRLHLDAIPTCKSCQGNLQVLSGVSTLYKCTHDSCTQYNKSIQFDAMTEPYARQLAIEAWQGYQRRHEKNNWVNLDQELIKIQDTDVDGSEQYWAQIRFLETERGKTLIVMLGKKGSDNSKVQFFIKDDEDQLTTDQVGDLNPKEFFLGFKAYFSDGATTETKY